MTDVRTSGYSILTAFTLTATLMTHSNTPPTAVVASQILLGRMTWPPLRHT